MTENEPDEIGGPCDSCASIAPALVMVEAHLHPDEEDAHLCRTCYDELAAESPLLPVLDEIVEAAEEVTGMDEGIEGPQDERLEEPRSEGLEGPHEDETEWAGERGEWTGDAGMGDGLETDEGGEDEGGEDEGIDEGGEDEGTDRDTSGDER